MVKSNLATELAKLSSAERILLAQDLWDSVAEDPDAWELTTVQTRELGRRLKAFRQRQAAGKRAGASWQQVTRRIKRSA